MCPNRSRWRAQGAEPGRPTVVKVFNFFDLRWEDGTSPVSDVPNNTMYLAIERIIAETSVVTGHPLLSVKSMSVEGYPDASFGVLRFDTHVKASTRLHTFLHVVMVAEGFEPLTLAAWTKLVTQRYGAPPGDCIQAINEQAAAATKQQGRSLLTPLEIGADDVATVLQRRVPEPPIEDTDQRPQQPSSPPRPLVDKPLGTKLMWLVAAVMGALAVIATVMCWHTRSLLDDARHNAEQTRRRGADAENEAKRQREEAAKLRGILESGQGDIVAIINQRDEAKTAHNRCETGWLAATRELGEWKEKEASARREREAAIEAKVIAIKDKDVAVTARGKAEDARMKAEAELNRATRELAGWKEKEALVRREKDDAIKEKNAAIDRERRAKKAQMDAEKAQKAAEKAQKAAEAKRDRDIEYICEDDGSMCDQRCWYR